MADSKRTGVGYYVDHTIRALSEEGGDNLKLEGYFFNFLGRNNNPLPSLPNVRFRMIRLIPGKALSVCRRLGFQPFLELFTRSSGSLVFYTNFVSLPMLRKKKVALAIYDMGFMDHPEYTQAVNLAYLQRFCPPSIRRADVIITISEFTKQRILHWFPDLTAPIVVTPIPPASLDRNAPSLSPRLQELGVRAGEYILFLSTIEPRKNIQNLVRAYALLEPKLRSKYALVLAGGKGWKDEAIRAEIAELQVKGVNILMTGYVSDDEKEALYASATGFTLPSHYEGFGMPVLEAMRYDIPVAISDLPIFHEAAGDAALYFDQNDPAAIAASLTTLVTDNHERKRLVTLGKQQLASFSWPRNAKAILTAFEDILPHA